MISTYFHDKTSVVILPLIISALVLYYKTFVFGENFVEEYVERFDGECKSDAEGGTTDLIPTNGEGNWNWTLYATGAYGKNPNWEAGEQEIDYDLILEDVKRNFAAKEYKNVRKNIRFSRYSDRIACPIYISKSTKKKESLTPDAIGIGFAKSGTGSLAMLRKVLNIIMIQHQN